MQLFSAKQYLQMDIASSFGLDKKDWDVRLQWFQDNEHQLMDLMKQAEHPALYFAGIQAWEDCKAGRPSGYPISLDATCSGLQILSVLTGDRSAAELCNVIDVGHRADAYTKIYQYMVEALGESAKIKREQTKDAILTSLYGSEAVPKQVFGEGKLLYTFMEMMSTHCPAAWELNQFYLSIWNPEALKYSWVLPDNFWVHTKVMGQVAETVHFLNKPYEVHTTINMPQERGRSLGANTTHSLDGMIVREMVRRCSYDPAVVIRVMNVLNGEAIGEPSEEDDEMVSILWAHYKTTGYLSARILDHLNIDNVSIVDAAVIWELIDSLPEKPFELITIHDCFRCLPAYGNDLRKQYNLQLSLIAKSNILSSILSQITGETINIGKLDAKMADDILNADYALS